MPRPFCVRGRSIPLKKAPRQRAPIVAPFVLVLEAGNRFSAAKHCGDYTRASTAINYSYNLEGYFVWSIGNQITANDLEAKRTGSEVGAAVSLTREERKRIKGGQEIVQQPVSRAWIEAVYVLMDIFEIAVEFGMKKIRHQAIDLRRAFARSRISRQASTPSNGWTAPLTISS